VLAPAQGVSLRGTSDDKLLSGDGLRKLLVKLDNPGDLKAPVRLPLVEPRQPVKGRQRASRRAVTGAGKPGDVEARAPRTAAQRLAWYNAHGGPSLWHYARVGTGRRSHSVDTTPVAVPLAPGPYEGRGVGKHDEGSRARGEKRATLRTLLAHAGRIPQGGLCPLQGHDLP
jgi:hypothetical protein